MARMITAKTYMEKKGYKDIYEFKDEYLTYIGKRQTYKYGSRGFLLNQRGEPISVLVIYDKRKIVALPIRKEDLDYISEVSLREYQISKSIYN
jgi:hypothetical protein